MSVSFNVNDTSFTQLVQLSAIILLIYVVYTASSDKVYSVMGDVTSDVDQRVYTVKKAVCNRETGMCKNFADSKEAANLLAKVKQNLVRLVATLKVKYPNDPDIQRLLYRFSPDSIVEGSNNSGLTTYTVNKGSTIAFCLRSRDDKYTLDTNLNTLMYVALHELAHILDKDHDPAHKNGFPKKMQFIIKEATELGIYTYQDYRTNPSQHCGITINS